MTATQSYVNINPCTTVLSADQPPKEETMLDQQKITILYCRLSNEDALDGEWLFSADPTLFPPFAVGQLTVPLCMIQY